MSDFKRIHIALLGSFLQKEEADGLLIKQKVLYVMEMPTGYAITKVKLGFLIMVLLFAGICQMMSAKNYLACWNQLFITQ